MSDETAKWLTTAVIALGAIWLIHDLAFDRYEFMRWNASVLRANTMTGEVVLCRPNGGIGPLLCEAKTDP